jgi:hypothetical protein
LVRLLANKTKLKNPE